MATKTTIRDLQYYLNLPWTYTVETTRETGELLYIVHVNELPGISTDAPILAEAFESIKEALAGALELYMKMGDEIPLPSAPLRAASEAIDYHPIEELRQVLLKEAEARKMSLNQFLNEYLAKTLLSSE